eukprot:CAMPEP_0198146122 /NCGR_PEP_ID=MMETSP1443-20131203/27527_1 /TAXON_ID=186043 /ORGANISM="Entomoneis sp., Strain CCMP2396" /LENGTH=608 /DNA_ID=CAMNT_0043809963 /DNA_START=65 /DNA_END=1891 /DNA_ORIENTATION=-
MAPSAVNSLFASVVLAQLFFKNGQAFSIASSRPTKLAKPIRFVEPRRSDHVSSPFLPRLTLMKATVAPSTGEVNSSSDDPQRKGKKNKRSPSKKNFKDSYGLNEAINKLADQASDSRQPVIRRAMAAEDLWKEFLTGQGNDESNNKLCPDTVSLNTVLKAWGKATQVLADHHGARNHDHLLDPAIPIYTARECVTRAQDILVEQENLYNIAAEDEENATGDVAPTDVNSYNTVMDAWAKSGSDEAIDRVEDLIRRLQKSARLSPDLRSYNALVDAYALSGRADRLEKLDRIWDHMEENPDLQPCSRTMNSILHAYSLMIKESPKQREQLANEATTKFERLKQRHAETGLPDYEPDVMSYTTAMDVWARVGTLEGTLKVEALFEELKAMQSTKQNSRPNAYSYTVLITAWSRIAWAEGAPQRVDEILETMISDKGVQLSSRPFTAALRCWSRGKTNGKAVYALNTLKRMKEIAKDEPSVTPNLQTYHAALECCSKIIDVELSQHTIALKIAFAILQSMAKDGIEANNMTYNKLLKCVETLLPAGDERNKIALAAFEKARTAGMADFSVIKAFQKGADVQVVLKAVGELGDHNGYIDFSRIPHAWKKNAR